MRSDKKQQQWIDPNPPETFLDTWLKCPHDCLNPCLSSRCGDLIEEMESEESDVQIDLRQGPAGGRGALQQSRCDPDE